jgi:hypothetical protein
MILPTKMLPPSRCLVGIGAEILRHLDEPKAVSRLWPEFQHAFEASPGLSPVAFSWFVLGLDLLFTLGAVRLDRGRLAKSGR